MKLPPKQFAQAVIETMRSKDMKVMTMKWPRLYQISKRERVTAPFLDNVAEMLRQEGFVMAKGVTVVTFSIDYDFAPGP